MSKVKFTDDYQSGVDVFVRNSIWDYIDKFQTLVTESCDDDCDHFVYQYRIDVNGTIHTVPETTLVDINYVLNKDYTLEEWNAFIMKDAIVDDGDYVKMWESINGIEKPVKVVADQCDYNPAWKRIQKKIDKLYGNGGFERP